MADATIEVRPLTTAIGAEIRGVDISEPLDAGTVDAVRRAAPFGDVSRLPRPWKFVETFLFDDARKRPLPKYPFRIALVGSRNASGAGLTSHL